MLYWKDEFICPIIKEGDKLEYKNYRGITQLNTSYKIFSNIISERLDALTNNIIGDYQWGFQKGRYTTDQIHRQILEKTKEYDIDTYHFFIDFRTVYDSINRQKLFQTMLELGCL